MAEKERSPEDTAEALLAKAKKGAGAESAQEYFGNYLWARLWKAITSVANCPPDLNSLLLYRSEIATCMKIAQDMQLDLVNAEVATAKIKQLFTQRPHAG